MLRQRKGRAMAFVDKPATGGGRFGVAATCGANDVRSNGYTSLIVTVKCDSKWSADHLFAACQPGVQEHPSCGRIRASSDTWRLKRELLRKLRSARRTKMATRGSLSPRDKNGTRNGSANELHTRNVLASRTFSDSVSFTCETKLLS